MSWFRQSSLGVTLLGVPLLALALSIQVIHPTLLGRVSGGAGTPHSSDVTVEGNAAGDLSRQVGKEISWLHRVEGRDFGVHPGRLLVKLYAHHSDFARALWRMQHLRPQSNTDDTSSIRGGLLLLGPMAPAYLWHHLAHVYTEWIMDGLSHNPTDRLPANPWLYDGLAEYEAHRYAPEHLPCSGSGIPPLDVSSIRTAAQWLRIRSGPLGSLEYCLAYLRVKSIVHRLGWSRLVILLHQRDVWTIIAP